MEKIKLLFLAPFPNDSNRREGMLSRVQAIDSVFKEVPRVYLQIRLWQKPVRKKEKKGHVCIYDLNLLTDLFLILRILKSAEIVYSHSIHMVRYIFPFLSCVKGKIVLDAHGAVPEEMRLLMRGLQKYFFCSWVERKVFERVDTVICVTEAMKNHFRKKYPKCHPEYIIYHIIPDNIKQFTEAISSGGQSGKVEVLYSGGIGKWQNIDKMMSTISSNLSERLHYTILSGQLDFFKGMLKKYRIPEGKITLKSVSPEELEKYYTVADYAFILRADNVINQVACPTKLFEYLFYGMIPIVLTSDIGDYLQYDYERIDLKDFSKHVRKPSFRSSKNHSIALQMLQYNKKSCLKERLLSPGQGKPRN